MWRGLQTEQLERADVAIFGIPFDENCSVKWGAADAPAVLRACSAYLPPVTASGKQIFAKLYDAGDIGATFDQAFAMLSKLNGKKLTVMLGGDHSVSILTEKAFRRLHGSRCGIIHLDAHADICDEYLGSKSSHACVNRRALENGYAPEDISMVGIRSYELQELELLSQAPIFVIDADECRKRGTEKVVSLLAKKFQGYDAIYLSWVIDSLDPAYAPGTGTPESFGLDPLMVRDLICGLFDRLPIRMLDLVEVSPQNDINDITSWVALKILLEIFEKIGR